MTIEFLTKTGTAEGAIGQYRIVKFGANADGNYAQASASTDRLMGVCNKPGGAVDGGRVEVGRIGIFQVVAGGTITRGDRITSDANGAAVAVTPHTHTENTAGAYTQNATTGAATGANTVGIAEQSAVVGDIFDALIHPGRV